MFNEKSFEYMFLIFTKQVTWETNHVVLMGISGGFPHQRCDVPDVGKKTLLTSSKKLFCCSKRAKYLDHISIYLHFKNYSEIPIFRGGKRRSKIRPIGLALRRQYVCPQPRGDSPFPVLWRELLRRPIQNALSIVRTVIRPYIGC